MRWLSEIDVINGNRFWKARAHDFGQNLHSKSGSGAMSTRYFDFITILTNYLVLTT